MCPIRTIGDNMNEFIELGTKQVWDLVEGCSEQYDHIQLTYKEWSYLNKDIIISDAKTDNPHIKPFNESNGFKDTSDDFFDWMDENMDRESYYVDVFCEQPDNDVLHKVLQSGYWEGY